MTNLVSIANQALGWLGAELITSIDDDVTGAKLVKANVDHLRRDLLTQVDWRFATALMKLPKSATSPEFGFANAFPIPNDTLKVITVNDNQYEWQRVGNNILTDEGTVNVRAIVDITDYQNMPDYFAQALAAYLSYNLAMPLTDSRSLQQDMFNLFREKLRTAKTTDGMQGKSRRLKMNGLLKSRAGNGTFWAGPIV